MADIGNAGKKNGSGDGGCDGAENVEQKKEKLASLIVSFVHDTMKGQESGTFKMFKLGHLPFPIETLKSGVVILAIFNGAIIDYLNSCYRYLILGTDQFILSKFQEMTSLCGHSEICLLNIIGRLIQNVHGKLDRSRLEASSTTTTIDQYLKSFDREFNAIVTVQGGLKDILSKSLQHTCAGKDIKTCDPTKPMFHASSFPQQQ